MRDWQSTQNGDGGWAYSRGCSWTEPTAFVLLAQSAATPVPASLNPAGMNPAGINKAAQFLRSAARADGGFSPQPSVAESTWVTALVALLPANILGEAQRRAAMNWLQGTTGRESGWLYRLQQRLAGNHDEYPEGWPWFPGAAAWVVPTALGILAFQRTPQSESAERIQSGKAFLFNRMCADGGWNHGSNRALGRDGDSYPETTGIALLALHGEPASPQLARAKAAARRHLAACRTAEGVAWLRMGLAAHGEPCASPQNIVCRTTIDEALTCLAAAPRNPLLP